MDYKEAREKLKAINNELDEKMTMSELNKMLTYCMRKCKKVKECLGGKDGN